MTAPADWYDDPEDSTLQRLWNGHEWTDLVRPRKPRRTTHPSPPVSFGGKGPSRQTQWTGKAAQGEAGTKSITAQEAGTPALPRPRQPISTAPSTKRATTGPAGKSQARPPRTGLGLALWSGTLSAGALVAVLVGESGIVAPIAYGTYLLRPVWGAAIPLTVWWAPVLLLLFLPARERIAQVAFGCRAPNVAERDRLEEPWQAVQRQARTRTHRLMITDSDRLNACTGLVRIVAVTASSATSLPLALLEAVLAHELGHQLGWSNSLRSVTLVLTWPGRALAWALRALWSPVTPLWRRAVAWHRPIGFLLTFLLVIIAAVVSVVVALPAVISYAGAALARWCNDQTEPYADAIAVRLGLGGELLTALEEHLDGHQRKALPTPLVRRAQRLRKQLTATTT